MTDIELLPLPEALFETGSRRDLFNVAQMEGYARAVAEHNVAAKDAEIEALRVRADAMAGEAIKHEARAERLAEALDNIARVGKASRNQTTRTRWIVARAVSALNGDNDWRQITKPKGYHDALERAALRDHDQEEGSGAFWGSSPKSGGPDWTGFDG